MLLSRSSVNRLDSSILSPFRCSKALPRHLPKPRRCWTQSRTTTTCGGMRRWLPAAGIAAMATDNPASRPPHPEGAGWDGLQGVDFSSYSIFLVSCYCTAPSISVFILFALISAPRNHANERTIPLVLKPGIYAEQNILPADRHDYWHECTTTGRHKGTTTGRHKDTTTVEFSSITSQLLLWDSPALRQEKPLAEQWAV